MKTLHFLIGLALFLILVAAGLGTLSMAFQGTKRGSSCCWSWRGAGWRPFWSDWGWWSWCCYTP
jgi:hypothetical protein